MFLDIFKKKNKVKPKNKSHFLPQDRQRITKLTDEKIDHMVALDKIDEQLLLIQKSTKTTFQRLAPAHDYCRMKWQWYYAWHTKPYANKANTGMLILTLIASITIISSSILSSPQTGKAAIDFAPNITEKSVDYSKIYASVKPDAIEIPEKRTENAKAFKNIDGTTQYIISSGILHYKKDDKWQNIDSNIEPKADNTGFSMDKSIYSASFGKNFLTDPLVNILKDGYNLSIRPKDLSFSTAAENQIISSPNSSEGASTGKTLTYKDAYGPGLDFSYETQDFQLNKKLNIPSFESLPTPTIGLEDKSDLSIALNLDYTADANLDIFISDTPWDGTQTTIENQNIVFKKDDKIAWQLTPAKAWDSSAIPPTSPQLPTTNYQLPSNAITGKTTLQKNNDKISISIDFPYTWLQTAQYPVTIDPTTNYTDSISDGYITGTDPSYATAHNTDYASNDTSATFSIGQYKYYIPQVITLNEVYRGFLAFDTSAIVDSDIIDSAKLYLTPITKNTTTDFNVLIYKTDWSPTLSANRAANYTTAHDALLDTVSSNAR